MNDKIKGIDLLLANSIGYELIHQIVLHTLFQKSDLPNLLSGIRRTKQTEWEPEGKLFDLGLSDNTSRVLLEIKAGASLTENQLERQVLFLKNNGHRGEYILLGTTWFEFDDAMIGEQTEGLGSKIGYEQLIDALSRLLHTSDLSLDVYELAQAYKNALDSQFATLKNAAFSGRSKDKLFYYSLFWQLKQKLHNFKTAIYTVNNGGSSIYILNNQAMETLNLNGVETDLYYELVNDRLCIKFCAATKDDALRRVIRNTVRSAIHAELDIHFKVDNSGRLGSSMTACQVEHDFSQLEELDKGAEVFARVGRSLSLIAERLR